MQRLDPHSETRPVTRFRAVLPLALALCAAPLLAACEDGPTAPQTFVHEAGGARWVAIAEPAGLPDALTWMPYLAEDGEAAGRVAELRRASARARREGDLAAMLEADRTAAREAASGLAYAPDAAATERALGSLDAWLQRAELVRLEGRFPEVDETMAQVSLSRERAEALIASGDMAAAAREITTAAEAARRFAPMNVAVRLSQAVDERIARQPNPSANLMRAQRLLRMAREACITGDNARAVRRAVYALQLLDMEDARGR